jgi:replicative DNA helicase
MSGAFEEQFAAAATASPLYNVEAEIGFLGDLLANNRLIDEVADRCRPSDFSVPLYGRIYGKMIEQSAAGAVDVVTLAPHFTDDSEWPRAYSVLAAADLNAGPKARTKAYFDQITMLSSRRRMVAGLNDVVASARDLSVTRDELVSNASRDGTGLRRRIRAGGHRQLRQACRRCTLRHNQQSRQRDWRAPPLEPSRGRRSARDG